jgi:hypothetical protein
MSPVRLWRFANGRVSEAGTQCGDVRKNPRPLGRGECQARNGNGRKIKAKAPGVCSHTGGLLGDYPDPTPYDGCLRLKPASERIGGRTRLAA